MKRLPAWLVTPALMVAVALALVLAPVRAASSNASGTPGTTTIQQRVVYRYPVHTCQNLVLITDPSGAPMWDTNCYETDSWGDGGKMVGGATCVAFAAPHHPVSKPICMTPEGDLVMQQTGPSGPYGPKVTLTPAFLQKLQKALPWILKAMKIRPRW